ncbi:MAG: helix-turn-helix transcriptional regulator [Deltaproteobacteria bacterium]|nr:helix-turn-helix transcriptional regulator [Deltaproteobacteria bacterium]
MIKIEKHNEYYEKYLADLTEHMDKPQEQSNPIHVGEKIKHMRETQGLSLAELAQKTGFELSMLENIEQEKITPPLGTMIRLSRALNTVMSSLFSAREEKGNYSIMRVRDHKTAPLPSGRASYHSYIPLASDLKDRHMDPFIVKLNPEKAKDVVPSVHDGEELIYVIDGEVKIVIEDKVEILSLGDTVYLKSTTPHIVVTNTDKPALILAIMYSE